MPASTKDTDRGFRRIVATLKKASGSDVTVGWHKDAEHKDGGGMVATATIAAAHEYGAGVPKRAMLAPVVDTNRQKYKDLLLKLWTMVCGNEITVEGALAIFGARVEADVKTHITKGPFKALAPETIARKGSSQPLIDTGMMRSQVLWRVFVNGKRSKG